jgi:nucleotide-binding universal stress UspA family protein
MNNPRQLANWSVTAPERPARAQPESDLGAPTGPAFAWAANKRGGLTTLTTLRFNRLLVPLDFSPGSLQTLDYAVAWATRFGGRVSLQHVIEPDPFLRGLRDVPFAFNGEDAMRQAEERLSRCWQHRIAPAIQGDCLLSRGNVIRQIVATARTRGTDLIVLTRANRRGLQRLLVRSRLKRIVRRAPCPTLTVPLTFHALRPPDPVAAEAVLGRRVLVPVDGSELSRWALKRGADLVEAAQGSLVVSYVPGLYGTASRNGDGTNRHFRLHTAGALEQRLWAWASRDVPPALALRALPEAGTRAADVLAAMASQESCDLIVMSSRKHSFRQRLVEEEIAEQLAGVASCPVLCLPEPFTTGVPAHAKSPR